MARYERDVDTATKKAYLKYYKKEKKRKKHPLTWVQWLGGAREAKGLSRQTRKGLQSLSPGDYKAISKFFSKGK